MRYIRPSVGDTRIRSGILVLPKQIGSETRWLEQTWWVEEYKDCKGGRHWVAVRWCA